MSVLNMDDDDLVDAINDEAIDDYDLIENWSHICRVRGRNFSLVDEEAWGRLCAHRGYVLYRRNPRGF